jgi:gliding motility-associated-like protein
MPPPAQPVSFRIKTPGFFLRKLSGLFVLTLLLFLPQGKLRAQSIYLTDAIGNVYLVDLSNCTSTLVSNSIGNSWFDLAICPGNPNIIYAIDGGNNLYMIDISAGTTTLVTSSFNSSFFANLNSLVCDGNGNLYAADGSGSGLYEYNIASGIWTFIGSLGGYGSGGDLTFYNGNLYLAGGADQLIEINLSPFGIGTVNSMTLFGVYGILTTSTASLCAAGTTTMLAMANNDVYTVNPANGNCTPLCFGMVPAANGPIYGAASIYEGANPPSTAVTVSATSTSLCSGQSSTLTATGAGPNGVYAWQPGNLSGTTNTVSPTTTTTYSVIGTDTVNGCSDTAYVTITVNPGIQLSGVSQNVSCGGACDGTATVTIVSGTAPFTYSWSPSGGSAASAVALCAGNYSCLVTGAGGCTDTQTFTITEPPLITAVVNQVNDSCFGQCTGSASLNVSGGSGQTYTYLWSPSGGSGSSASALCAGNYSCTITDSVGCILNQPVVITQPNLLSIIPGNSVSVCAGSNVALAANITGGTVPYSFSWQPGNMNSASPVVTPTVSTVYSITVTDANNCTTNGTQTITVNPLPTPSFVASDSSGCSPLCVTFTSPTQSGDICTWNFGDGNTITGNSPQNHCYTLPGTYTVSLALTDADGCSAIVTENNLITVFPSPFASFSYSPQFVTLFDPNVSFTDQSTGADSWFWDFGDAAQSNSILQNPQFIFQDTGCFNVTLTVSSLNGCTADTTEDICIVSEYVFYVPNTFTPNGNGVNDIFLPVISGYAEGTYHLMIFDRWGNLIFESTDADIGWDGKVQDGKSGKLCQIDTYVWVIDVSEWNFTEHEYRGHVNLIR